MVITKGRQKMKAEYFTCWTPTDNEAMKAKYEGVCGPASIAANEGLTIAEVLEKWCGVGPSRFKGFSPIADMKETLKALGWSFNYIKAGKARTFPTPRTGMAILRIQWLKEDGSEYYWRAAGPHSHYVLMKRLDDGWWIFCNGEGWFRRDSRVAKIYLGRRGFVSSYLELYRTPTMSPVGVA